MKKTILFWAIIGIINGTSNPIQAMGDSGELPEKDSRRYSAQINEMGPIAENHSYAKSLLRVLDQNQDNLLCGVLMAPIYGRILGLNKLTNDPNAGENIARIKGAINALNLQKFIKKNPIFSFLMEEHGEKTQLEHVILTNVYNIFYNNPILTYKP